jgi:phospholipid/cholesterol/gamma-HCH transport system ATP-binding protein
MHVQAKNNEPPVIVKDLHKSFGQQKVLDGVDLEVARGETLSVLGRSGTGKSVLLRLLIGLQSPDSGSIRILGQEITRLDLGPLNEIRKKIGFLFQHAALYDSYTIEQNVDFPLARHTDLSAQDRKEKVRELLSKVGMEHDLTKMPSEISGGMQKRVALARALALDPEILLFDEPTAGLDPITSGEINRLIMDLNKEHSITSIVVTHDLHSAKTISDRLLMLHEGHVLTEGSFDDLQHSKEKVVVEFLREVA